MKIDKQKYKNMLLGRNEIIKCNKKTNFIYKLIEEKLQATINSHDFLEKKIVIFLGYLILANTFLVSYVISRIKTYEGIKQSINILKTSTPFYWQILTIIGVFLIMGIFLIWICLRPKKFAFLGNEPRELLENINYCKQDINKMMMSKAIPYQEGISNNQKIIKKNKFIFNLFLVITMALPILFIF